MTTGRSLVMAALLLLVAGRPPAGEAASATDQLRADIDEVYATYQRAAPDSPDRAVIPILDRMFDWSRMAQAALRDHWAERTPQERTDFTGLFAQLFRRAYVSRIHVVDASRFRYLGDATERDRTIVKTQVFTKRGSAIDVDYAVRLGDDQRWRVEDVRVESESLIDNYRSQFDTVIARSSYEGLVARLRKVAR